MVIPGGIGSIASEVGLAGSGVPVVVFESQMVVGPHEPASIFGGN